MLHICQSNTIFDPAGGYHTHTETGCLDCVDFEARYGMATTDDLRSAVVSFGTSREALDFIAASRGVVRRESKREHRSRTVVTRRLVAA